MLVFAYAAIVWVGIAPLEAKVAKKGEANQSVRPFVEEGYASWYGRSFHGLRTASGEHFDMYLYTAAHKRLPLGTWVRVTNKSNGKIVWVRINDRGPYHSDRIIDLSYQAAKDLGMIYEGTEEVIIEEVNWKTTPKTEEPKTLHSPSADSSSAANLRRA
jgi:rare lipoprotein A